MYDKDGVKNWPKVHEDINQGESYVKFPDENGTNNQNIYKTEGEKRYLQVSESANQRFRHNFYSFFEEKWLLKED